MENGLWHKRCPVCGDYMTKKDPMDINTCRICGWKEECALLFCDAICAYCHITPRIEFPPHEVNKM